MKYVEDVEQWIRDDKSLTTTVRSLYNIVWDRCLNIMKDKVSLMKDSNIIELEGGVNKLLMKIRKVSL